MSSRRLPRLRPPFVIATLCLTLLTLATGCGQRKNHPSATVTGKVMVGSKPVGGGIILFTLTENPNVIGTAYIRTDGTYEATNAVPVGNCKVTVKTSHLNPVQPPAKPGDPPRKSPEYYAQMSGDPKAGKAYTPVPAKYEAIDSTTLSHDVPAGESTYEIKLDEK